MTLHELKTQLQQQNTLAFELPDIENTLSFFDVILEDTYKQRVLEFKYRAKGFILKEFSHY